MSYRAPGKTPAAHRVAAITLAALAGLLSSFTAPSACAADATAKAAGDWKAIEPALAKYCYDCHGGKKTKGDVDLKRLAADPTVAREYDLWNRVNIAIEKGEMPPEDKPQLKAADKKKLQQWLSSSLEVVVRANAGDPGPVTLRRLTNAEYDYTIRDLTGIQYGLGKDFLPDGGGGEGFSNIGDVLFTSPQQLEKYVAAARKLADHATILPGSGITFQPTRVGLRGPDQLKAQGEQALYVWYQKMAAPYLPKDEENLREADYMLACWKYKYREMTGSQSLEQLAKESNLYPAFLANWWSTLNSKEPQSRYLDLTRIPWQQLPGPDPKSPKTVPDVVTKSLAAIDDQRKSWYDPKRSWASIQRVQQDSDGIQAWPLLAETKGSNRVHIVIGDVADGNVGDFVTIENLTIEWSRKKQQNYFAWLQDRLKTDRDALTALEAGKPQGSNALPADKLKARIAEGEKVAGYFGKDPQGKKIEANVISVKAPVMMTLPFPEDAARIRGSGKLDIYSTEADAASVQWMATVGEPPDPSTVLPGTLTVWKRSTPAHHKLMGEFERMKNVFPDIYDRRLEEVARNYHRGGKGPGVYYFSDAQLAEVLPPAEKKHMAEMLEDWRFVRNKSIPANMIAEWDEKLRGQVERFATAAWRRPLAADEKLQLASIYNESRKKQLDQESSAREVMVRVMASPNYLFKLEESTGPAEVHPVTPWELASRLSYFLWSSMPDETLRAAAADGSLSKPEVVDREVKRMLRDPKATALAREFGGQWLEFHNFEEHKTVDEKKYPEFTSGIRTDMQEEAVSFFSYIVREDRPVREILQADYTFLNERLANYYGVPNVKGDEFQKISVSAYQRGGLLGMGSVLTKTSYPQRTSPVVRGNWLLKSVLGTPVPPPPNNVPKLDEDTSKPKSLRERLERHRADKACASCHDKIDPLGFALQSFDAVGRRRTLDEMGIAVDNSAEFKDGTKFNDFAGLKLHLAKHEAEFTALMCRKLIGYALGRNVLPTDKPLIEQMEKELKTSGGRFSTAILAVAQSKQFQTRRNE
ncbi:MAG TPA: DUF1592 domain-containing protein [Roseimicrobium sp.]|nr:DUF1592 domain-containing protein [Roseimicrobium sp.]